MFLRGEGNTRLPKGKAQNGISKALSPLSHRKCCVGFSETAAKLASPPDVILRKRRGVAEKVAGLATKVVSTATKVARPATFCRITPRKAKKPYRSFEVRPPCHTHFTHTWELPAEKAKNCGNALPCAGLALTSPAEKDIFRHVT